MLYWVDQTVFLVFSHSILQKKNPNELFGRLSIRQYQAQYLKQLSLKYQFKSGS